MPEKCFKCKDDIIPPNPILKYNGDRYHAECLTCSKCDTSLGSIKFIRNPKGLMCVKCDELYGLKCFKCKNCFKPGEQYKRLNEPEEKCYHVECFQCSLCLKCIPAEFYENKNELICLNCHRKSEEENAKYCAKCHEMIKYKFVVFKDNTYHQECFDCAVCLKSMETTTFYRHDNIEPVCNNCHQIYLKKSAKTCFKCNRSILDVGIECGQIDYHEKCLTCFMCDGVLQETALTNSSNEIYCEKCYMSKYGKKCDICKKYINPTEACAKFEDKNFHKECFSCLKCNKSIADIPFIKRDSKYLCVNCK